MKNLKLFAASVALLATATAFNGQSKPVRQTEAWYIYNYRCCLEKWGYGCTLDFTCYSLYTSGSGNPVMDDQCLSSDAQSYVCAILLDPQTDVEDEIIQQVSEVAYNIQD